MKTIKITNSGNFQKDVNKHFNRFCSVRTECWRGLDEIIYVGFVRVGMYDYVIDSDSAKKINTNTMQVGCVIELTIEETSDVKKILAQEPASFESQYDY